MMHNTIARLILWGRKSGVALEPVELTGGITAARLAAAPAPEQNVPQSENQPQMVDTACHMVYCTGPNPLGEQKTIDFPSLAVCREWLAAHRSADLAHSCGYTVYAGSNDHVSRDGDGFPVVLLTHRHRIKGGKPCI